MLHKEFWGLLFLAFVVWIFTASSPSIRIENACRPIGWSGNVIVSLSALAMPAHQTKVQGWFNSIEYGCQYTVWRLFYQEAYNKWREESMGVPVAPSLPAPGSTPQTPVPPSEQSAPAQ